MWTLYVGENDDSVIILQSLVNAGVNFPNLKRVAKPSFFRSILQKTSKLPFLIDEHGSVLDKMEDIYDAIYGDYEQPNPEPEPRREAPQPRQSRQPEPKKRKPDVDQLIREMPVFAPEGNEEESGGAVDYNALYGDE